MAPEDAAWAEVEDLEPPDPGHDPWVDDPPDYQPEVDGGYWASLDDQWDRLTGSYHGEPPTESSYLHVAGDIAQGTGPFIDWDAFWKRDRSEADFLLDDVIVRGRGHTIYAPHKAGKSLFTLWVCTEVIRRNDDVVVMYLDYEMTEDDLQERLEDMGYGPRHDLTKLRYWVLPTLPPLNTAHGADALLEIVQAVGAQFPDHHLAVIIDTTSRAVSGEENDSGPYRDFYRLTGLRLKQMGVTWVRLDHEGKDKDKGQRGSSAKGDDIDVAWRVSPTDGGMVLVRKLSRLSWVPEKVAFHITEEPLRYVPVGESFPAGTADLAKLMDTLGIPVDASANAAQGALRDAGHGRRRILVTSAQRYRRRRDDEGVR